MVGGAKVRENSGTSFGEHSDSDGNDHGQIALIGRVHDKIARHMSDLQKIQNETVEPLILADAMRGQLDLAGEIDRLADRSENIAWLLVKLPARTLQDLRVKAVIMRTWLDYDPDDLSSALVLSLCHDVASLSNE